MGCSFSSSVEPKPASDEPKYNTSQQTADFRLVINDKSPRIRLDTTEPGTAESFAINGESCNFTMKYFYVSQRGYYPNAMGKANQDSYAICENFLGDKNTYFFGIFDGHGEYGDSCSHFAANAVPCKLVAELKKLGGVRALDGNDMEAIHTRALVEANQSMRISKIDDSLSGTTSISVLLRRDNLYVANVGDSRAIIASDFEGKLRYSPLSNDQTPFRRDERERVKRCGAKVLTLAQVDGNEPWHENWGAETGDNIDEVGDPPRIWNETLEQPGCAFTRSLGDAVGEAVGVCAEPEVLAWRIGPTDRYVIIASDGVFEFLTSQAVVDIFSHYENDVLEGAKNVVAEAYRLWLTYDDRTDDISIIVLALDNYEAKSPDPKSRRSRTGSFIELLASAHQFVDSKPVRRAMTKAKRALISEQWELDDMNDMELVPIVKTTGELARIGTMVQSNVMFQSLDAQQKEQVFQYMYLRAVNAGDTIIKEGDRGDEMYIIDRGDFAVFKRDEDGLNQEVFRYTTGEWLVTVWQIFAHPHTFTHPHTPSHFSHSTPHTAHLFTLAHSHPHSHTISPFSHTSLHSPTLTHPHPNPLPLSTPPKSTTTVTPHSEGAAFGELSLIYGEKRAATVRATTEGAMWVLGRKAFRAVLMRKTIAGLISTLKMIPSLEDRFYTDLQRLCNTSFEMTFENRDVIAKASEFLSGQYEWTFFLVKRGTVELSVSDKADVQSASLSARHGKANQPRSPSVVAQTSETRKRMSATLSQAIANEINMQYRGEGAYFAAAEFSQAAEGITRSHSQNHASIMRRYSKSPNGVTALETGLNGLNVINSPSVSGITSPRRPRQSYNTVISHGQSTLAFFPTAAYVELVGKQGEQLLTFGVQHGLTTNRPTNKLIFNNPERRKMPDFLAARSDLVLIQPVIELGQFGYVGNFQHAKSMVKYSIKVIAKYKSAETRMDTRILDERNYIAALNGRCRCVPKIFSKFQDSRVVMMIYSDIFSCDLATAIASGSISISVKPYFAACIYAALSGLHHTGLFHRFITPDAVYITDNGMPMLADLRYCKVMDGSRCYTICGDPHYFAPEIINHQGYDYGVDLWAFGVLLYEMYEGVSPFGADEADESELFNAISSFQKDDDQLPFTAKTPHAAIELIRHLLEPDLNDRQGYVDPRLIRNDPYFVGLDWDRIGRMPRNVSNINLVVASGNSGGNLRSTPAGESGAVPSAVRGGHSGDRDVDFSLVSGGGSDVAAPYIPVDATAVAMAAKPTFTNPDTIFVEESLKPHMSLLYENF